MAQHEKDGSTEKAPNARLVAYFRSVLEAGPLDILDQYAAENNPVRFRFADVQERNRDGRMEAAFDAETGEQMQDGYDAILDEFGRDPEEMLRAARIANCEEGDWEAILGESAEELTAAQVEERIAGKAQVEGRGHVDRRTIDDEATPVSPNHDDTTTVDVVLYEEGRERVVHINKRVFGFFQRLRPAMGTLEGYHPETRFEEYDLPGFAAEHAELLAKHGHATMIDAAIAVQVEHDRATGESTVLSDNHDNRGEERIAGRSARGRYEYHKTNGEDALIRIDAAGNVTACAWGWNSERRARWVADMESGDARDYIDLDAHQLDEPVPYREFVATQLSGSRVLAEMIDEADDRRDGSRSSDAYDECRLQERVEELEEEVARLKAENDALDTASFDGDTFYTYHCADVEMLQEVRRYLSGIDETAALAAAVAGLIDRVTGEGKPCPYCDHPPHELPLLDALDGMIEAFGQDDKAELRAPALDRARRVVRGIRDAAPASSNYDETQGRG